MRSLFFILVVVLSLSACRDEGGKAIPYTLAKNYFVKNTVDSLSQPEITNREDFESIFGMATTMGDEGAPTSIDFSKQSVIAVVLPETKEKVTLIPEHLRREGDQLIFSYKKKVGQEQSFTSRPSLIVVFDKTTEGEVVLKAL